MTKEDIIKKIKDILAKDDSFKEAKIEVILKSKNKETIKWKLNSRRNKSYLLKLM